MVAAQRHISCEETVPTWPRRHFFWFPIPLPPPNASAKNIETIKLKPCYAMYAALDVDHSQTLSDQEIHLHLFDNPLPVPTVLHIGVHHLPHPLNHFERWFDIA